MRRHRVDAADRRTRRASRAVAMRSARAVVMLVLVSHVAAFGPRPRPRLYAKPEVPRKLLEAELALRELSPGGAAAAGLLADGVWRPLGEAAVGDSEVLETGSTSGTPATTRPRFEEYALRAGSRTESMPASRALEASEVDEYSAEIGGSSAGTSGSGLVPVDSIESMAVATEARGDAVSTQRERNDAVAALERERRSVSPVDDMFAMLRRESEKFVNPRTGRPFEWGDTWMHSRGGGVGTGRPESRPRRMTKDGAVEVMPAKNDAGFALVPMSSDKQGLLDFYDRCNGPRWSNMRNWGVGEPCANAWHGVLCVGGRVVELLLNLNNVACMGSLNVTALADHVHELRYVDLSDNLFTGDLPKDLFKMTQLQSLVLSGNRITGTLSEDFASLKELRHLDLSANALHGPLPRAFGELSKLEVLYLGESGLENKNDLVGPIPESWRGLKSLKYFSLAGNQNIGGTLEDWLLNSFDSLHELTLSNCGLQGEIPSNIDQLKSLIILDLGGNALRGEIPLASMPPHLKHVRLAGNKLTGTLNSAVDNLREIETFDVSRNKLKGDVPGELLALPLLEILDLSDNEFTGALKSSPMTTSNLRILDAENNSLRNIELDAEFFRRSPQLRFLKLSNNGMSGSFADDAFEAAGELIELHLSHNDLSGPLPSSMRHMTKLKSLRLNDNAALGAYGIPEGLAECADLRVLDLSRSGFQGSIPDTFFERMTRLVQLNLASNNLTGRLPASLKWASEQLRSLQIQRNGFVGEIPEWLIERKHLELVDFSSNSFSGTLPNAFYDAATRTIRALPEYGNRRAGEPRTFTFADNPLVCPLPHWARVVSATCRTVKITSMEPTKGAAAGGDVLVIVGNGFSAPVEVGCLFGTETSHVFVRATSRNDTHVSCVVPSVGDLPASATRRSTAGFAVSVRIGTQRGPLTVDGELFVYSPHP